MVKKELSGKGKDFDFNPGEQVFCWEAHDYHPHKRGLVWIIIFSLLMFGMAFWAYISDPKTGWVAALTIFLALALYFYMHRNGDESHMIYVFEEGFFIDQQFVSFQDIEGFWFTYDETVSVIHFERKGKSNSRVTLQMGENHPDLFRRELSTIEVTELTNKQEGLIDLWIRALKL